MLTPLDLKLEYRFDTGEYPATDMDYAEWLEDQLLYIRNRMSIVDADIVIENENRIYVLDTKWKVVKDNRPSPEDLKQMYVYHKYYKAQKVALVYPGDYLRKEENAINYEIINGRYCDDEKKSINKEDLTCGLIKVKVEDDIKNWQKNIRENIYRWMNDKS